MTNIMTNEEAIAIIRNEYKCVDRDCDIERSCGKCDLMMPNKEPILEAYKLAIKALEQQPCEDIAQERYKDLCEYFGGAKDILKSREDFNAWLERIKWHIRKAEELYEKYEYKKEPCEESEE